MNTFMLLFAIAGGFVALFLIGMGYLFLFMREPVDHNVNKHTIMRYVMVEKKEVKKHKIARFFVYFFIFCIVISIRYFDNEGAVIFIVAAIGAAISALILFKLDR